ncbi:hypothetical protein PG993_005879 [Apiospora rasikravindrae]|uniref:Uncharacterized protein n=1 Tax=Apiospora rasikravindrae TaxID=990691 RepID=A0ABR1TA18_9PEZI
MWDPALRYHSPSPDYSDSEDWRARSASDDNGPGSQVDPSMAQGYDLGGFVDPQALSMNDNLSSVTPIPARSGSGMSQ